MVGVRYHRMSFKMSNQGTASSFEIVLESLTTPLVSGQQPSEGISIGFNYYRSQKTLEYNRISVWSFSKYNLTIWRSVRDPHRKVDSRGSLSIRKTRSSLKTRVPPFSYWKFVG